MQVLLVLVPFLVAGLVVHLHRVLGRPRGRARGVPDPRRALLHVRHRAASTSALGMAVPAAVIASRGESEGGVGPLRTEQAEQDRRRRARRSSSQTCRSCHTLAAVQAHGVTGPNLDELGPSTSSACSTRSSAAAPARAACPRGCSQGEDAQNVAAYVSQGRRPVAAVYGNLPLDAALFPSGACAVLLAWPRRSKPKPRPARGAWGNQLADRPGANRADPRGADTGLSSCRSATLSARARQLTPQATRKRADAFSRCPRSAGG